MPWSPLSGSPMDALLALAQASASASALLCAAWAGAAALRRGSAAARHQIWALGVAGALAAPLLSWVIPAGAPAPLAGISAAAWVVGPSAIAADPVAASPPIWPSLALALWAAGAALVASRFVRAHLKARDLWSGASPAEGGVWEGPHRAAAAALGIGGAIPLRISARVSTPMTLGVLRPGVLLPEASAGWAPERLTSVLLHELGHVRRGDLPLQRLAQALCALHWFNPLTWLAAARLRWEREGACDDLVLMTGVGPASYAADLLAVARLASPGGLAGAVCMAEGVGVEARLRRILDGRVPRIPPGRWGRGGLWASALALTSLVAVAVAPAGCASNAETLQAARSSLTFGRPYIEQSAPALLLDGVIDLDEVSQEVGRRLGGLEQCYDRRLADRPGLSGEVVIHVGIDPDGQVIEACISQDSVKDEGLLRCVNELVASGQFPAPAGGAVDVSLPFRFEAGS